MARYIKKKIMARYIMLKCFFFTIKSVLTTLHYFALTSSPVYNFFYSQVSTLDQLRLASNSIKCFTGPQFEAVGDFLMEHYCSRSSMSKVNI